MQARPIPAVAPAERVREGGGEGEQVGCGEERHLLDARGLEAEGVLLGDRQADLWISGRGCIPRKNEESFSCNVRSKIDGIWTEQCRFLAMRR